MNKYVAAALSIAVAIGPASALDAGLGGEVGGVGVGSDLGVGNEGAAVGGGTSVDGVGGADVGGSIGTSNGSPGAGVGADGELGGTSGGLSTGVGSGGTSSDDSRAGAGPGSSTGGSAAAPGSPAGGSAAAPGGTTGGSVTGSGPTASGGTATTPGAATMPGAVTTPGIRRARGVRQAIALPRILLPSKARSNKSGQGRGYPLLSVAPLKAIPGTPSAVVRVCRQAIESAARPLGAVNVRAASAGPLSRQRRGALTAPIHVRIDYESQAGIDVRQARIRCHLDVAGRVIGVT
jgi:hypothetical protein